jgi:hypothetical protein
LLSLVFVNVHIRFRRICGKSNEFVLKSEISDWRLKISFYFVINE